MCINCKNPCCMECSVKEGPRGPKGDQGSQGEQGIMGIQGPIGPSNGPKGEKGEDGIRGDPGPVGAKGQQGIQGSKGEQGIRGNPGINGTQGVQGLTGSKGEQGDVGPTGQQGNIGQRGDQGSKGDQGDIGLTGQQGAIGSKGDPGIKGDTGTFGPIGPKGDIGPTGPQGSVQNPTVTKDLTIPKEGTPVIMDASFTNTMFVGQTIHVVNPDKTFIDLEVVSVNPSVPQVTVKLQTRDVSLKTIIANPDDPWLDTTVDFNIKRLAIIHVSQNKNVNHFNKIKATDTESTIGEPLKPFKEVHALSVITDGLTSHLQNQIISDINQKNIIGPSPYGLDYILQLVPKEYTMKYAVDKTTIHQGLIAQEVEQMSESQGINISTFSLVQTDIEANGKILYGLRYGELTAMLINCIKELNEKIKVLENK